MRLCLSDGNKQTKLRKGDKITLSRIGHIKGDMHSFVMTFKRDRRKLLVLEENCGEILCLDSITIELSYKLAVKFISLLAVSCGLSVSQEELIKGDEYIFTFKELD